jgi:hypothetical protein
MENHGQDMGETPMIHHKYHGNTYFFLETYENKTHKSRKITENYGKTILSMEVFSWETQQ